MNDLTAFHQAFLDYKVQQSLRDDDKQSQVVLAFDRLYVDLMAKARSQKSLLHFLHLNQFNHAVPGLYLWGPVGRGKTMVMDVFFKALPFKQKTRQHYQHFMAEVHQQLNALTGQKDRLEVIAKKMAKTTHIICFDEFDVKDVADAMILGPLFEALFKAGVALVITSNVPPEQLYLEGLARDRFLHAIQVIQKNMVVYDFETGVDYRTTTGLLETRFYSPTDGEDVFMQRHFEQLSAHKYRNNDPVKILGRSICVEHKARYAIWFQFSVICGPQRGPDDYMYLSKHYPVIMISQIPHLDESQDDAVKRFIGLIDELYDQRNLVFISSENAIQKIYSGDRLSHEIKRTISRLIEMQTKQYQQQFLARHQLSGIDLTQL